MKKVQEKRMRGITLIALVISIIVLLILSGVTISALSGDNGLLKRAAEAKEKTEDKQKKEEKTLKFLEYYTSDLNSVAAWDDDKKVNVPQLTTGMKKIMFTDPTSTEKGTVVKEGDSGFDENNWYSYTETDKKWANVQTEDGSMWVWIPRFAYKITYTDSNDKSKGGTIDVKFLIGTTDDYYDGDKIKTAQRQKTVSQTIDATLDYTVHPAFTNEKSINFANGGWDKEISGIWVAKFEAGYAGGNNTATQKKSSVKYTQSSSNFYGSYTNGETKIKYPVFQGVTYSMNYISINDSYNISRALTESGNIYGLTSSADSHLMKNSEWGACAYLSKSQYGLGTTDIVVNRINLANKVITVYAVTGVSANGYKEISDATSFKTEINAVTGDTATTTDSVWTWAQLTGTKTSTTGTIYGVYDMSGGLWEKTAAYIPNSNDNLSTYGKNVAYNDKNELKTVSTKYTTVYPYSSPEDSNIDTASGANWGANTKIYGDGVRETSAQGNSLNSSWYGEYSYFPAVDFPFFLRGGLYLDGDTAGMFAFSRTSGIYRYSNGFRPVLVVL